MEASVCRVRTETARRLGGIATSERSGRIDEEERDRSETRDSVREGMSFG